MVVSAGRESRWLGRKLNDEITSSPDGRSARGERPGAMAPMTERTLRRPRALVAKADSDHVRRQNRALVLSMLRRLAPIARVDLGAATQLSPATITAITADLLAEGLIETVADEAVADDGDQPARRGRPRILLRLDPRAVLVLGIKLSLNHVTLVAADFAGTIVARRDLGTPTLDRPRDAFPAELVGLVRAFLSDEAIESFRIAEITVAAQGFVDTRSGSIMWSPAFRQRDIRLVEPLEAAFGVPCVISNDANMIAQALHAADPATYHGTFAVIFVDYGVGMGLFVGDRLHHGADGSAAEFGHMNHIPDGPLCRCGRRGCVEAFTADYAIYRDARHMPPDTDPLDATPTPGDLVALEAAAYAGDAYVRGVYAGVGKALGYGLARLMALINPSRIVLTGASTRAYPLFSEAMNAAIDAALVEDLHRFTVIETLPWERDMIVAGMVADALARLDREVFANPADGSRFRA
jgi:predicted NBD/HSP70 family sugar kinase